jgi:sulfur relay (sulfurtransferase) complex TusBCD TusD component (DsrE family)
MQLANVARLEGHEVNIFLTDDGVIYAKPGAAENVVAPTGDEMQNFLEQLCQAKTPIYV